MNVIQVFRFKRFRSICLQICNNYRLFWNHWLGQNYWNLNLSVFKVKFVIFLNLPWRWDSKKRWFQKMVTSTGTKKIFLKSDQNTYIPFVLVSSQQKHIYDRGSSLPQLRLWFWTNAVKPKTSKGILVSSQDVGNLCLETLIDVWKFRTQLIDRAAMRIASLHRYLGTFAG